MSLHHAGSMKVLWNWCYERWRQEYGESEGGFHSWQMDTIFFLHELLKMKQSIMCLLVKNVNNI